MGLDARVGCACLGAALAACGGAGGPVAVPVAARADTDEPQAGPDAELLGHDLEATVLEIYSHISLGNFAAYRDSLASEEPVVLFGVRPDDVLVGRQPAGAARDRRLFGAMSPTLLSKNLEIHLSPDGSVGWTFDEMSYRVTYRGRTASIPIRNTSLFVRDFDRWVLVMEHQSYPTAIEDLRAAAAAGRGAQPRRFASRQTVEPARELVRLVGLLHNAEPRDLGRRVAPDATTLVLLPDAARELRGREAAVGPSLATIFGPNTTVGLRDYRVGEAKNQTIAWMAANLILRTAVNDQQVDIGLRGTYVFRRTAGEWELVQMHISAPVGERELGRRVFGTP
ncbi:MAG TPA: nuclear transport factor 2 family protein [Kofleriaceae bacterium]|nr:nuclear transport factor 2 family protein [Kofleriaceae bacterium]